MRIFNCSITNGIFPVIWRTASATPVCKSESKSDLVNYRPISVILVFARVLERLAHEELSEFLKVNDVLTSSQAAFRKLYSNISNKQH